MLRRESATVVVLLFAVAAFLVALFTIPDASEAEQGAPETTVARTAQPNQGQAESASEAQYSNAIDEVLNMPQSPAKEYYGFYARWLMQEGALEVSKVKDTPSEGSTPGLRAPAKARSFMKPVTPYSQIVDNASHRRYFSKHDWEERSWGEKHYGKDFEYILPKRDAPAAWFRTKIPTAGRYTVYARWPAGKRNNPKARFRIGTASGLENVDVNQRKDGSIWVRLGAYDMKAGDRYSVRVAGYSKAEGRVIADAVKVVRGTQVTPQAKTSTDADLGFAAQAPAAEAPTGGMPTGNEVIQRARTHLGTPYRHSPPMPCQAYVSEDCSCFTRLVFGNLALPDDPIQQWQVGSSVEKSDLRPGDLVFFKEAGESNPITHVAIYSGNGNIIHSSSYWGSVVERPMKYVNGYYGAKRLN